MTTFLPPCRSGSTSGECPMIRSTRLQDGRIIVDCGKCVHCGKQAILDLPAVDTTIDGLNKYIAGHGGFVQDVLPHLSAGDREMLITGTHDACFDEMFPPEETAPDPWDELCGTCQLTYGSHRAFTSECPDHEDRMDWSGVAHFVPTGEHAKVAASTPALWLRKKVEDDDGTA